MRSGESRQSPCARTGAPACASTALRPTVRSSVLLPDMFEPLTSSRCGASPPSRTSLATAVCAGSSGCASASASNRGGALDDLRKRMARDVRRCRSRAPRALRTPRPPRASAARPDRSARATPRRRTPAACRAEQRGDRREDLVVARAQDLDEPSEPADFVGGRAAGGVQRARAAPAASGLSTGSRSIRSISVASTRSSCSRCPMPCVT